MEDREQRLKEFKSFLLKIRTSFKSTKRESTWQELFEEWFYLVMMISVGKMMKMVVPQCNGLIQLKRNQSLDESQIEQYVEQCKDALEMVSGLLSQFNRQKKMNNQKRKINLT